MTDTPQPGAADAASARSRTPSSQLVALILLGGGAYALVAAIIYVVAYQSVQEPVRLMLAGFAGSLLTIPLTIAGFYFGAALKQAAPEVAK